MRPPNTDIDTTPPAPGDLELVRGFLSLHDHLEGTRDSLPPSLDTVEWWFREHGLLTVDQTPDEADLRWAAHVLEAGALTIFVAPGVTGTVDAGEHNELTAS